MRLIRDSHCDEAAEKSIRIAYQESIMTLTHGPDASAHIATYIGKARTRCSYLGEQFTALLDEEDLVEIAGRLKYVGADILVLEGCGKAAAIAHDPYRDNYALGCFLRIEASLKCMQRMLELTKGAARLAA